MENRFYYVGSIFEPFYEGRFLLCLPLWIESFYGGRILLCRVDFSMWSKTKPIKVSFFGPRRLRN